jgi:hypothetical protein
MSTYGEKPPPLKYRYSRRSGRHTQFRDVLSDLLTYNGLRTWATLIRDDPSNSIPTFDSVTQKYQQWCKETKEMFPGEDEDFIDFLVESVHGKFFDDYEAIFVRNRKHTIEPQLYYWVYEAFDEATKDEWSDYDRTGSYTGNFEKLWEFVMNPFLGLSEFRARLEVHRHVQNVINLPRKKQKISNYVKHLLGRFNYLNSNLFAYNNKVLKDNGFEPMVHRPTQLEQVDLGRTSLDPNTCDAIIEYEETHFHIFFMAYPQKGLSLVNKLLARGELGLEVQPNDALGDSERTNASQPTSSQPGTAAASEHDATERPGNEGIPETEVPVQSTSVTPRLTDRREHSEADIKRARNALRLLMPYHVVEDVYRDICPLLRQHYPEEEEEARKITAAIKYSVRPM